MSSQSIIKCSHKSNCSISLLQANKKLSKSSTQGRHNNKISSGKDSNFIDKSVNHNNTTTKNPLRANESIKPDKRHKKRLKEIYESDDRFVFMLNRSDWIFC